MKLVLQLFNKQDGNRSEPMAGERTEIANRFRDQLTEEQKNDFGIIILLETHEETAHPSDWGYSKACFMNVTQFIQHYSLEQEISHE